VAKYVLTKDQASKEYFVQVIETPHSCEELEQLLHSKEHRLSDSWTSRKLNWDDPSYSVKVWEPGEHEDIEVYNLGEVDDFEFEWWGDTSGFVDIAPELKRATAAFVNTLTSVLKRIRSPYDRQGELAEQSWIAGLKYAEALHGELIQAKTYATEGMVEQNREMAKAMRELRESVSILHNSDVNGKTGLEQFEAWLEEVKMLLCLPLDSDYYLTAPFQEE
jgi:hypothetical protein